MSGFNKYDVHAEIRCIILSLRNETCLLPPGEKKRIEDILWSASALIGKDPVDRTKFKTMWESQHGNQAKKRKKAG